MSFDKNVSDHYTHGELLETIKASIDKLGKTIDTITIEDLAAVDEFHIGGRKATDNLLDQLNFTQDKSILDVGCGLGGASRYIANKYNNYLTGIDLTQEYIDVGNILCEWVGLNERVSLHQGSALSMPFEDEIFDGAIMLHVGMNIDNKTKLFGEVYRVLRPGSFFGVYDVMQVSKGELTYPVPWATESNTSSLGTPDQYKQILIQSKFKVLKENIRIDFALDFFNSLRQKSNSKEGPAPLGLHILMQESTKIKVENMVNNIQNGLVAPVEIIVQKI